MNKTSVIASAAAGLTGVVTAVLLGQAAQSYAAPTSPAAHPAAVAAQAKAIDAADRSLTYKQSGTTVTVSRKKTTVAALALRQQTWTDNSAHLQLRVSAQQPFKLDTNRFVLYDAKGAENSVKNARTVRFEPGTHTLVLDFANTGRPEAVGWVPQDGEGGVAIWERPPVRASDPALTYRQSGKTVTGSRKSTVVAAVTLAKATYTSSSVRLVLRVTAKQAFTLDTDRFLVYDVKGGENSAGKTRSVRFGTGTHTLTIDFTTRSRPEAAGWVPQDVATRRRRRVATYGLKPRTGCG